MSTLSDEELLILAIFDIVLEEPRRKNKVYVAIRTYRPSASVNNLLNFEEKVPTHLQTPGLCVKLTGLKADTFKDLLRIVGPVASIRYFLHSSLSVCLSLMHFIN